MTNTNALLDKARELCSPPTDYQLAKRLEISTATLARCRRRNGTLDNQATLKLAQFLQQDFKSVLALVELDRAKTDKQRNFWERVAPRLVPSFVVGALAAGLIGLSPESHSQNISVNQSLNPLYIMRTLKAWIQEVVGRCRMALLHLVHAQHPCQISSLARASGLTAVL